MFKESRVLVNSKMEITMKMPPIKPPTASDTTARPNEIAIINKKTTGPKPLYPKALASYLLKTTELTEEALHKAQTAGFSLDDTILVRCRFDNENQTILLNDVVMTCPAYSKVYNVQEVITEYLGADERFLTLKMYLDHKRKEPLNINQDVRSFAFSNDRCRSLNHLQEVVFFVKFESSEFWKKSFLVESVQEETNGDSNGKTPSTSTGSLSEAQPSTSQQSNQETSAPENQNDGGDEESDEMPQLDMETPCEEPEMVTSQPVELAAPPRSSPPKTIQSEARVVYVDRPLNHLQPNHNTPARSIPHPVQRFSGFLQNVASPGLMSVYAMFTLDQKREMLKTRNIAVPPDDTNMLDCAFCSILAPREILEHLYKDYNKKCDIRSELHQLAKQTDSSSPESQRYREQKHVCKSLNIQIKEFEAIVNTMAVNPKMQKPQRHTSIIKQDQLPPIANGPTSHPAVPASKLSIGTPVSVSQSTLKSLQPVGTIHFSSTSPPTLFTPISLSKKEKILKWEYPPCERPTIIDKEKTIKALQEFARWAVENNVPRSRFLERYKASESEPKQGELITSKRYEGCLARRHCDEAGVMIPNLSPASQEKLCDAVTRVPDESGLIRVICEIMGWEDINVSKRSMGDNEYSATRSIVPLKIRRIHYANGGGGSPPTSEISSPSNISSPGSMDQQS